MAEYSIYNLTEYDAGDSAMYCSKTFSVADDINTNVRKNIPKYSKITAVTAKFKAYHHATLLNDNAEAFIFFGDSRTDRQYKIVDGGTVPEDTYTTISGSALSHFITSGANAGETNSNVSANCSHLWYVVYDAGIRTLKQKENYLTWTYTPPTVTVNVSATDGGNAYIAGETSGTYEMTVDGMNLVAEAYAKTGYRFVKWSDGTTSSQWSKTLTQDDISAHSTTISLEAIFEPISYTVSASVTPPGSGTVTGGGTYEYGSTVTLTATPNDGYKFVSWDDGNTNASRTVTVTADAAYSAQFEQVETSKVRCGTKEASVYCGIQKISVYCGTQKIV